MNSTVKIFFILSFIIFYSTSCKDVYYTMDDFGKVPKVDVHAHLHAEKTALTEQAAEDGFRLINITLDQPQGAPLEQQFEYAMIQKEKFPQVVENITAFTLHNWNEANWQQQVLTKLKADFEKGAIGIKIWKNIGMSYKDTAGRFIMIDHPRLDTIFRYVEQQGKIVIGHLGEPRNCWLPLDKMTVKSDRQYFENHPQYHMFLHPEYPSYEEQIAARDHVLEKFPELRFVGAHLGSLEWEVDELAKRLDKYPNLTVDMAERICHWQHQSLKEYDKVRSFIIKYQDRLMYGTDIYIEPDSDEKATREKAHKIWMEDWKYFTSDEKMTAWQVEGEFKGLKLTRDVVDKIFYKNAVRVFELKEYGR